MTQKRKLDIRKKLYRLANEFTFEEISEEIEELYSFQTFIDNSISSILQSFSNDGLLEDILMSAYGGDYSVEIYQKFIAFYTISDTKNNQSDFKSSTIYKLWYQDKEIDFPKDENDIFSAIDFFSHNSLENKVEDDIRTYLYYGVGKLTQQSDTYGVLQILSKYFEITLHRNFEFVKRLVSSNILWDVRSIEFLSHFERDFVFSTGRVNIDSFIENGRLDLINWQRLSSNTRINWNEEIIDRFIDNIDFARLCTNESVNWNFQMITKYEKRVIWTTGCEDLSVGDYTEKYAGKRKSNGVGLFYNKNIIWTKEIVEEWKDFIDPYEIALNGELNEIVVWNFRNELLELKLFSVKYEGPRDDKERIEVYKCGFENLIRSYRKKNLSARILEFLARRRLLKFFRSLSSDNGNYNGSKYSFSESHFSFPGIGLDEVLKNQYSWVLCFMQTRNSHFYNQDSSNEVFMIRPSFWSNSLKDILLANKKNLCRTILQSFQKAQKNALKTGSIIVNLLNSNPASRLFSPEFFILEEEYYWYYKVRKVEIDNNSVILSDKFRKINKSPNQIVADSDFETRLGKKYFFLLGADYDNDEKLYLDMRLSVYCGDNLSVLNFIEGISE
jgi:hypothetical protein